MVWVWAWFHFTSLYVQPFVLHTWYLCVHSRQVERKKIRSYILQSTQTNCIRSIFFRLVNTSNGMHGTRITYTIWYFLYGESNVRQCNPWQQKIASHPPLRKKERNDGKPHRCFDPKRLRSKHINSSSSVTHSPFSKYTPFQISNSFFLVYTPLLKPRRKLNMHIFYSKFLSFL